MHVISITMLHYHIDGCHWDWSTCFIGGWLYRLTFTCFFSWKRIWNHVTGTTLAHLHYSCHLCRTNTQTNVWGIQADDILEKLNHDNVLDAVKGLNHITGTILLSWWPCMWGHSHTAVGWQLYKMSWVFFFTEWLLSVYPGFHSIKTC